jgi:hypothetical protein
VERRLMGKFLEFELFDMVAPTKGETQIRTVGLRISSYATDGEGIPVMTASSRERLYSSFLAKAAFDSGRHSIDEPEPEPAVIRRPQVVEPQTLKPPEPAPEPKSVPVGRTCQQCGLPFPAKRSDARFCSPACRKRASRDLKLMASGEYRPEQPRKPGNAAIPAA